MDTLGPTVSRFGLDQGGIVHLAAAHWNLGVPRLYREALRRDEGLLAEGGALVVLTGQHTGRSPNDKYIVRDQATDAEVWWGKVNQPMAPEAARRLFDRACAYLQGREAFVQDLYCGADPMHRMAVRIITEHAWHSLFARNMFIVPPPAEQAQFEPAFTILQVPDFRAEPERDGTRSDVAIVVDFMRRWVLICGTSYAGEIKKSVFTVMNHLLPARGVMPMHCSANVGAAGDTAIFFGLSGTGKTTLSADPSRTLVGDDEHGWTDRAVFNFEGGCYAKVIRLSADAEPEIFTATRRFGTVLENVVVAPDSGAIDLDNDRYTENTRASYPLEVIPNASATGIAGVPENIVMLTADAFGVLPPISRLTPDQAMYHFLSGYTARVAGTEKGVTEPQATFSTCFGAPFMPRHPTVYARLLGDKMHSHGATCWLVNTGWTGGGYGVGHRMRIAHTRAMIRAALDGRLATVALRPDPVFGLAVPDGCPEVPTEVLNPRNTWTDPRAYDRTAHEVAGLFERNFTAFADQVAPAIRDAGIHAAA